jgi:hypothetical protein
VRHDDAFTHEPDQHIPEIEGTSPGGHGGGAALHVTTLESHSFARMQAPSKQRTPLAPATWQGSTMHCKAQGGTGKSAPFATQPRQHESTSLQSLSILQGEPPPSVAPES